ncbi:MAG: hypothetical protein KAT68_10315 [Bacteroidales bacterium]|nr:hypothetical protein [Bacteroidales bacterium]
MKKTKILLIEHDDKRDEYKNTIEQAGAHVELIPEFDIEKLKEYINNNYFDFIITDVFFLPKGQSHHNQTLEDEYRLPEIVNTIRKIDKRVKIIVYSQFNNKLYHEDLEEVDYVFDKRYITSDLFKWQLERLIQSEMSYNYNEHTIIRKLLELLQSKTDLIWKDHLTEMLEGYRNGINEIDQVKAIKSSFIKIFQDFDFSDKASELLDAIQHQEPLNIAGSPTKWGHLRHVINVFWLGYYIINNGLIDINKYGNIIFSDEVNIEDYSKFINQTWLIAALFHDIGHFGENINKLINQINKALSNYPDQLKENQLVEHRFNYTINEIDSLKAIIARENQTLHDLIKENHTESKTDHGFLSAMTTYKRIYNKDNSQYKTFLDIALRAMALHNIFEKNITYLKEFSFNKLPFVNLLILCDHLEVWDRDTGFESMYNEPPLEKIELYELKIKNQVLHLTVNYQMHRALISSNVKITEDKLIELINKFIKPPLDHMKNELMPKIHITFRLNHRIELINWTNVE